RGLIVTGVQTCALPISTPDARVVPESRIAGRAVRGARVPAVPAGPVRRIGRVLVATTVERERAAVVPGRDIREEDRRAAVVPGRSEERRVGKEGRGRGG